MKPAILLLLLWSTALSQPVSSPEELIRAVHDRYRETWYTSVTFTQMTVESRDDGSTKESIWYEQLRIPSSLSIRFDPRHDGNGMLFARDTMFVFQNGDLVRSRAFVHHLLLLGFDIYGQPAELTIRKLRELQFDLNVWHEAQWEGRPAYVVGAKAGDDSTKQFWFDKERLVLVRVIEKAGRTGVVAETRFNKYQKIDGGWIETEVLFFRNGKLSTQELYSDIRANVTIPDEVFDPSRWKDGMKE